MAEGVHARHRERRPATGALAWLREVVIVLVSALVLSLVVKTFLVQAFFIPSGSMHDTLLEGDRVLVSKLRPDPWDVRHGDIVVFADPGGWLDQPPPADAGGLRGVADDVLTFVGLMPQNSGEHLIKRVIGLPGDHVSCAGAGSPVLVNGVALDEPYLVPGAVPSEIAFDVVVPDGALWVMGDNRPNSLDSRWHTGEPGGGFVDESLVVGVAFVRIWPADRLGVLHNPGPTFATVPAAS